MTRLLRVAAVAVLVGGATGVLSSCTGDPGSIVTQTSSPTATTEAVTPSPSPAPSVTPEEELLAQIPDAILSENFQSATQFAKLYILEYQRMFDERDPERFAFLAADECGFCASSLQSYADLIGEGGSREGGEITIEDGLAQGGLQNDGFWYVEFEVAVSENWDHDGEGNVVDRGAGGEGTVTLKLSWVDDRWSVNGVNVDMAGSA